MQISAPGDRVSQFQCSSSAQLVVGHCTIGEGRSYAQLAELTHQGGRVTKICVCGEVRPYEAIQACVVSGSAGGSVNSFRVEVPQHSGAAPEDVVVCFTPLGFQLHSALTLIFSYLDFVHIDLLHLPLPAYMHMPCPCGPACVQHMQVVDVGQGRCAMETLALEPTCESVSLHD